MGKFEGKVLENMNTRDKLFNRFKKSRLHSDKDLNKKEKYNTLKLEKLKISVHAKEKTQI